MRRHPIRALLLLISLLTSASAVAHHSFSAEFTSDKTTTITGVVTEVWFRNPHIRLYVDVTTEDGETVAWDTRGTSPSLLVRRGWTKDRVKPGDVVTIYGHSAIDPERKLLNIIWVELADGTRLK